MTTSPNGTTPPFHKPHDSGKLFLTRSLQLSQRCRKKVEECFGWLKTIAGLARLRHVGQWKIEQQLELAAAAFNLIRLRKLAPLT